MTDQRFVPRSHRDMVALVDAHPLAKLISRDFYVTLLPRLFGTDDEGRLHALLGHDRANPQRLALGWDQGSRRSDPCPGYQRSRI